MEKKSLMPTLRITRVLCCTWCKIYDRIVPADIMLTSETLNHTHTQTHTNSCSLSSCYTICLDTETRHTLFIHQAAWGCSPVPSALSRPGPSPSWSGCVSSAWQPWFAETPPWPRCRTPGLSASAPVCASPLWPTWEAAGNNVRIRLQIRFDGPVRSSNAAV